MRILLLSAIIFAASMFQPCSTSKPSNQFDRFQEQIDAGKRARASRQFELAHKHFRNALQIAKEGGSGSDAGLAYSNIAQTYCNEKRFQECEESLNTGRDMCLTDSKCSSDVYIVLLDKTRFLYVYLLKDKKKIESLTTILADSTDKLEKTELDRIGCRYSSNAREAGFVETAELLTKRHDCDIK